MAAQHGNLTTLKWARANGCPWNKGTMQAAATGMHLDVLKCFLGSLDAQRRAHDTLHMSSHAAHTTMTGAIGGITTGTTPASPADAQEANPGLPDHLVVTHILRTEYFDDPADLARLPAVSRGMRAAVAETELRFEELTEICAANLGCLSALKRLQRRGCLSHREYLCEAAARGGNLVELKVLRANGCPWDTSTC
jgi:hypothetical protein